MNNKQKAIEWWNILSFDRQIESKRAVLGDLITMEDLTGSEIEFIYNFYHQ